MKFWVPFCLGLLGCAVFGIQPKDAADLVDEGAGIASCEAKGRAAKDAGQPDAYGVYDDCMKDAGLR